MNINCICGGRFKRTDIESIHDGNGGVLYRDTDPLKANWKCDGCGKIRTQNKRQPKAKM
jgi:hypothetical protein